jgi:hypothetical protein
MIKPIDGQELPDKPHSRKRIWFICDCGNKKQITWKNYSTNHTKSCGKCKSNRFSLENLINQKFGKLLLDKNSVPLTYTSKTKVEWICDCGNKKICEIGSVVNGYTKSCGCIKFQSPTKPQIQYEKLLKSYWLSLIPELINENLPNEWSKNSNIRLKFKCRCGNIYKRRFGKFKPNISTCTKCDFINVSALKGKKFGKLTFIDDSNEECHGRTDKKFLFKCDCGNEKMIGLGYVIKGYTSSCSDCNLIDNDELLKSKFGHLSVVSVPDKILKKNSEDYIRCSCTCGNTIDVRLHDVLRSHTKSCGRCYELGSKWWENKNSPIFSDTKIYENKYSLNYLTNYFSGSYLTPLEGCSSSNKYIKLKCKLCGNEFNSKLSWIWYAKIVSCGCIGVSNISYANLEISKTIEDLGIKCLYGKNEFKIDKYRYDVKANNLIIEHNGLRYHKDDTNDFIKYKLAKKDGYDYLMIYEDEWIKKKNIFMNIIKNKLNLNKPMKLRPQQCLIKLISNDEISDLYEKYHYIGKCISSYNIGVFYKDTLVAGMSLRNPVRQNSGNHEISRMVSNFDYKIYGLWSYLLDWTKNNKIISGKLITFSDNRLSDGNVYQKMGFTKEKEIKPDYYWYSNKKRIHKSTLRKTESEKLTGKTESELRNEQGYSKIYDVGKIKWSICI